jgi:hypothetical protein
MKKSTNWIAILQLAPWIVLQSSLSDLGAQTSGSSLSNNFSVPVTQVKTNENADGFGRKKAG